MTISILGTGALATRLADLLQPTEHRIVFGSRTPVEPTQLDYRAAITAGDLIVLAIPYTAVEAVAQTFRELLNGKIIVDPTNPIHSDWSPILTGEADSAAEQLQRLLPDGYIVKAFNSIFADALQPQSALFRKHSLAAFIASDHPGAAEIVRQLALAVGLDAIVTGPLYTARYLEQLAHLNIAMALGGGGTQAAFVYTR